MQRTIRSFSVAALAVLGIAASSGRALAAPPAPVAPAATPNRSPQQRAEPILAASGPAGDYLRRVHARLHGGWTEDFVKTVAATYPTNHPLNDQGRQVTVALTVRWDGSIAEATIKSPSGSPEFDKAAIDIARKGAPYPLPPADVVSDDSYAHVNWTFARDSRACAAGAEVARVDDSLEISLPRLVLGNRIGEALRRVGQAGAQKPGTGLDRFAHLYLARTVQDPVLDVAAAAALADTGDQSQESRLRLALASRATAEMAGRGLRKLGVDVCAAVREPLEQGTPAAREIAISATRAVAGAGGSIAKCQTSLTAIVADAKQPSSLRLLALDMLATHLAAGARPTILAAMEDKDMAVRGAAVLASVRKGAGRPEMYRLAPMLHDKTVEVRAAASAGMVRAGGDLALDQLYLLARETDPRPGLLVAAELARMSTDPSAEFLGKMARKNNLPVQMAAVTALASRADASARIELDALKGDERAPEQVRQVAVVELAKPPTLVTTLEGAGSPSNPTTTFLTPVVSVRELLKNNRTQEAATWIVERFESLQPRDAIDVLGAWLLRAPAIATAAATIVVPQAPAPSAASAAISGASAAQAQAF